MSERAKNEDFVRVRSVLQREVNAGHPFDDAVKKAATEEPDAYKRIMGASRT